MTCPAGSTPSALQSELCEDIWFRLNQSHLEPWPNHLTIAEPAFAFASKHFTDHLTTKVIDVWEMTSEDESFLSEHGIMPAFLRRNLRETLTRRHLDPLAYQLKALRRGCISAISPFSGKPLTSNRSFLANINVMFYRFQAEKVFYVAAARIGSGFPKSALYFPEANLLVTDGNPWGLQLDDLVELKARMVSSAGACYQYLRGAAHQESEVAVCLGFYHFAHHLWNELSGLHKAKNKGLLGKVDKFLVLREPVGPIAQIFPEIPLEKIKVEETTAGLFNEILDKGYFALRVGDDYIPSDLTSRVARVSQANCSPATLTTVKEAKAMYEPILWLGIRVGNRSWIDQAEGLTSLIASLRADFPKLGVVFDGFSLPSDVSQEERDQQGFSDVLDKENEIVDRIVSNLTQRNFEGGLYNIIGLNIRDANVWAQAIDVYVSPHGSLQHKVGWFAKKTGIVHTNQTLLKDPPDYVWTDVEDAIPPTYIDSAAITDFGSNREDWLAYNELDDAGESGAGIHALNKKGRGNPEFNNYSVHWESLRGGLVELLRPGRNSSMSRLLMKARVRHKILVTVRSITSAVSQI